MHTPDDHSRTPAIPEMTPEHEAELLQMQNSAALADKAVMDVYDIHPRPRLARIEGPRIYPTCRGSCYARCKFSPKR